MSKRRKKTRAAFCSPRCRLLSWAAHELLKAYQAGRADGLQAIIRDLREEK